MCDKTITETFLEVRRPTTMASLFSAAAPYVEATGHRRAVSLLSSLQHLHRRMVRGPLRTVLMPIPTSNQEIWKAIARGIFSKQDLQQLPLKKAIRKLCRKGSKKFGVEQSDENLQQAVNTFIHNASSSGFLVLQGSVIALADAQQTATMTSGPGVKAETGSEALKAIKTSTDTTKQHATASRKRKAVNALDGSAASHGAHKESLEQLAPVKAPIRKRRPKGAPGKPLQEATASETQDKERSREPPDEAPPAKRKNLREKAREPTPRPRHTGGRAVRSNDGSMPGIPGSGAADLTWKQLDKRTDVKRGRFSEREKETLLQAVKDFARAHNLSDTDLSWIYNTKNNLGNDLTAEDRSQRKGAWSVIAQSLPHRTPKSVWAFVTRVLHEGNYLGKWSAEDTEKLLQLHAERGNKWKEIGAALGRHPENCRYKHRDLLLGAAERKGKWNSEEEAKLLDLVTRYTAERPEPNINSGRTLIDAVNWDVISRLHGTRAPKACRQKWYDNLAPSMVSRGDWGLGDDRRLLKALYREGHSREWQVDWGAVVPERSAAAAKRRWRLMLKSVPAYQEKEFPDIVEELVSTHLPALKQRAGPGAAAGARAPEAACAAGVDAADEPAASG